MGHLTKNIYIYNIYIFLRIFYLYDFFRYSIKLDYRKDRQVLDSLLYPGECASLWSHSQSSSCSEHNKTLPGLHITSPTKGQRCTLNSSEQLIPPANRCSSFQISDPILVPRPRLLSEGSTIPENASGTSGTSRAPRRRLFSEGSLPESDTRTPRRRLFSEGSVPEDDSGISSPVPFRRYGLETNVFSSNVILEDGEFNQCVVGSGLFLFDDVIPHSVIKESCSRRSLDRLTTRSESSFCNREGDIHDFERVQSVTRARACLVPVLYSPDRFSEFHIKPFATVQRRERTYTNQSLRSFGSPIDILPSSDSFHTSTPLHHTRERTRSG